MKLKAPILIAPMAFHKLVHPEGELATARAAKSKEIISIISTMSTVSLEKVITENPNFSWFQLYIFKNRHVTEGLVRRAEESGYKALVVTIDVPQMGVRPRDLRNQFKLPSHLQSANLADNKITPAKTVMDFTAATFDAALTWDDIAWLKNITKLPIILKGILSPEDVQVAIDNDVEGIILSNHGGRQLDSAITALGVLPEAAKIIQGKNPLMIDGGVRCGTDIFKALALGANAVLMGRPILWGLAYDGVAGVQNIIDILHNELLLAMQFCGCKNTKENNSSYVRTPFSIQY